jgi:hypothetical protein
MRNEHINVLPEKVRTPTAITILATVMNLAGVVFALAGLAFFFMGSKLAVTISNTNAGLAAVLAGMGAAAGVVFLAFGGLHVVLAIGLLQHRNAARILTILLFGLSTVGACMGLVATSVRFSQVGMTWNVGLIGVDVWVLWYLLRPQTKNAFNA